MNGKVTYRQQYTRCGKQRCRKCREGAGHGPYWYAYWNENGRTVSKYIGIHPPADMAPRGQEAPAQAGSVRTTLAPSAQNSKTANTAETPDHALLDQAESGTPRPAVRVYLLGRFRMEQSTERGWQPVDNRTWQRRRARALLGCLLSQNGRHLGREQAMEALWPELDIETAANRLNGAVHELRQVLEPDLERPASSTLLRLERDTLILADSSQIWVDADAFEVLLNRVNLTRDREQVEQMLEEAWLLYEGDYLVEELYSEWAAPRRESLRRGWMGLLLNLATLRMERGALTGALDPLERLLTADPTHEAAVRRLMVLLTRLDRRGEALRAYQRLAALLKRDYESDPLPETVELYKKLRQGQLQVLLPLHDLPVETSHTRQPLRSGLEKSTDSLLHPLARTSEQAAPPGYTGEQDLTPSASSRPLLHPILLPGRHHRGPLIGRELELETLHRLLLAVHELAPRTSHKAQPEQQPRQAHCVMITGETGIGKTRLAEEVSRKAQELGWRVAWTRAYEQESTIPYRPWTDILRTLLQDIPLNRLVEMIEGKNEQAGDKTPGALDPAATAQARLTRLSSLLPELVTNQQVSQTHPPAPVAPEQERFHLWEALLALLKAFTQTAPLLLVLDDLHWTDDNSLELLAYLARHQQNERLVLVGTYRELELVPRTKFRSLLNDLRREQVLATFPLQALTQEQTARLLAHLPHELIRRIQSQAGGNPLFAEELARFSEALAGEKYRNYRQHTSHYTGPLDEQTAGTHGPHPLPLPETIAAVFERRLNKLGPACQALLSKAAVLGRSFELNLLVRVIGETESNEDAILDLLEEALHAGLLTEEVKATKIVYHFWHPLIVSHLYEHISAARRAQLHRRTAQALIDLFADNEAGAATAIAYHLHQYGQDKPELAYYTEIAGNQAMALSAYPQALHYYRLALEALQTPRPTTGQDALHSADLLECMAECNYMQGNVAEARQQYMQVLALREAQTKDATMFTSPAAFVAWQQEEAQIQGTIWRAVGRAWKYIGEFGQAHVCAERGRQVLHAAGITTGAAWSSLQHLDGSTYWVEGNFNEARRYLEDALKIHEEMVYDPQENMSSEPAGERHESQTALMTQSRRTLQGNPLELGRVHESLGVIAASMARYTEALQHLYTALSIFEKHGLVGVMGQVCSNIGAVHSMHSAYTIATTYFKRALELGERTGDLRTRVLVTGNLGDIAARHGDLQEAVTWLTASLALVEQTSNREHTSWVLATLGAVQQDMGDMRGALENIRRALAAGHTLRSTSRVGFALVTLASWRVTRALILSRQDVPAPLSSGLVHGARATRPLLSAQAALERALSLAGIDTETACIGQVVLTAVHYHLGDLARARQQANKALEETRRSEMMHLVARAQRLYGEIQAASGLEQAADASFEEALQTCQKYGLRLDYARTLHRYGSSLLARDSSMKSTRGPHPPSRASLVGAGLDYLHEARDVFAACQANLDLRWIESELADPVTTGKEA